MGDVHVPEPGVLNVFDPPDPPDDGGFLNMKIGGSIYHHIMTISIEPLILILAPSTPVNHGVGWL